MVIREDELNVWASGASCATGGRWDECQRCSETAEILRIRPSTLCQCFHIAAHVSGKVLQEDSETCNVVWFGDGDNDQKSGGRTVGGRVEDVEILFVSDEDGHD